LARAAPLAENLGHLPTIPPIISFYRKICGAYRQRVNALRSGGNAIVNDSVGALHVALAAAVVGWLVFCVSHSFAVWKKRNADGDSQSSRGLLYVGLLLCAAALGAGWLNRELTRRAGVILGTDFFVVRAHAKTIPHLIQGNKIDDGATLATFEDPEREREEEELKGEIRIVEEEIAGTRLKPLVLDSELVRLSQDASDSQRARLSQLGYGVLPTDGGTAFGQAPKDDELAAQREKSKAAETQLARTAALVQAGIVARNKLEPAEVAAKTADQELRERENLIQAAKAGSETAANSEAAVLRDGERAKAERTAELAELDARLAELRTSLLQLHQQRSVMAPFAGTVVYRHPSPALVGEGKVILALAKGPGFLATVQLPAREAAMLVPGQKLRMKLKHSLVSEEITGRLQSVQPVSGYPDRRDLLIECDLPPEQFSAFSAGMIPITLKWRPPLYTDPVAQAGLVFALLPMIAWLFKWVRAKFTRRAQPHVEESEQNLVEGWSYSAEEEEMLHQLGVRLGEDPRNRPPSTTVLKETERALDREPAVSAQLVKAAVFVAMREGKSAISANPSKEEIERVLAHLGLTSDDLRGVAQ
jgi:multidrug resistance efflux pump